MTKEFIQNEITALEDRLETLKNDMVLTDGAIQVFRYILAELEKENENVSGV